MAAHLMRVLLIVLLSGWLCLPPVHAYSLERYHERKERDVCWLSKSEGGALLFHTRQYHPDTGKALDTITTTITIEELERLRAYHHAQVENLDDLLKDATKLRDE